ncbi:MAG: pentapeptide repeat-containing protein [Leptolyngbyaceae cyanobacterium RU_5_1]|nr:pentapeptide repeat-containing protein [Leptolyngbyaceae cyanobacterium RU_5_1]
MAVLVGHAISRLVFGVLGQTPTDRAWGYVIALLISSGIAGGCSGIRSLVKQRRLRGLATVLSGTASGALIGFFYAGTSTKVLMDWLHAWFSLGENPTQNYPQAAIAGAVVGGLGVGIACLQCQSATLKIAVSMAGALAAYGFTFLIGAMAIAVLNTRHLDWGMALSLVSLIYLWLTVKSLAIALQQIKHAPGTLFRQANLTAARFAGARLTHTDFSGAIGALIIGRIL